VEQAAARLRTEAKTTGGLGRKQTAEPPFPVETSPEKPFFDQLMDDPAYAKAVATLLQQQLEGTYGRLFAALNLNPTDQQRLEDLLTQRLMVGADARGLLGPDASQQERNATKAAEVRRINAEIQSDFGPAVMKQIRDYDGVTRIYNTVDDLETQLSYTTTPLQPAQAEQLVHMIVQILGPRITTVYWSIPQDVIAQSNSMLAPRQIAALKQVQAMQLANIQARDMRQNATDP